MYDIKYDDFDLVIAMLKDIGHIDFYQYYRVNKYVCKDNSYLMIYTEKFINMFKDIMKNSIYMKYLNITKYKNSRDKYVVMLNELGKKERNNIENLLKLKGLFK